MESEVLADLKHQISSYREDHDLSCIWDDELSYVLSQSVWKLEMNKLSDDPLANTDKIFQQSILRCIPESHTFKGFPSHFQHAHSQKIFVSLKKIKACHDILLVRGDKVRFGLQVRCFPYAESSAALWIMIGVRFKSL